jgi:hypothetical protein
MAHQYAFSPTTGLPVSLRSRNGVNSSIFAIVETLRLSESRRLGGDSTLSHLFAESNSRHNHSLLDRFNWRRAERPIPKQFDCADKEDSHYGGCAVLEAINGKKWLASLRFYK